MVEQQQPGLSQIDFNLHQILGIRLIDPSPQEVLAVGNQLGLKQTRLEQEPDLVIRFVDRLALSSTMRFLTIDEAGFTEDAFLILRSKHKAAARVKIAFEKIGQQCEIICERGLPSVPLLIPIINLTVLAKGALPIHASAFSYNGTGVLSTGWSKGGKTEMLMAFASKGARYVGDEWIYITSDGNRIVGIPEPIRLWDWHLRDLPGFKGQIPSGDRNRLFVMKQAMSIAKFLTESHGLKKVFRKMLKRAIPLLKGQLYVDVPPQRLFNQSIDDLSCPLQKVFFVASHESPEIVVRPIDPFEIANRMVFSYQYEQLNFLSYYLSFRFAFPHIQNTFLEKADAIQRERLIRFLADKESYGVYHPYPVNIPALYETVCPYMETTR